MAPLCWCLVETLGETCWTQNQDAPHSAWNLLPLLLGVPIGSYSPLNQLEYSLNKHDSLSFVHLFIPRWLIFSVLGSRCSLELLFHTYIAYILIVPENESSSTFSSTPPLLDLHIERLVILGIRQRSAWWVQSLLWRTTFGTISAAHISKNCVWKNSRWLSKAIQL